jgi:hypothetical protein
MMTGTACGTAWAPHGTAWGGPHRIPYIPDAVPHPDIGGNAVPVRPTELVFLK